MPKRKRQTNPQPHNDNQGGEGTSKRKRKNRRPPKWVREQQKRQRLAQEADVHTASQPNPSVIQEVRPEAPARKKPQKDYSFVDDTWKGLESVVLQRSQMFYGGVRNRNFIFNALDGERNPERWLYQFIFQASPKQRVCNGDLVLKLPSRVKYNEKHVIPLLNQMIARARKIPWGILLEEFCPLPNPVPSKDGCRMLDVRPHGWESHNDVSAYIWVILKKMMPSAFLGNENTKRAMKSNIARFIGLNRYETLNVKQAVEGIKTQQLPWLCEMKAHLGRYTHNMFRLRKLGVWMEFLISHIVIPVLKSSFYITEGAQKDHQQKVVYFRKPVWHQMVDTMFREVQPSTYVEVTPAEAEELMERERFGHGRLKWLPKNDALRPVVSFSGKKAIVGSKTVAVMGVNRALRDAKSVLEFECERRWQRVMGSSIRNYGHMYKKLFPVLRRWQAIKESGEAKRAYILTTDVTKAFDRINVGHLIDVVKPLFQSEVYRIISYKLHFRNGQYECKSLAVVDLEAVPKILEDKKRQKNAERVQKIGSSIVVGAEMQRLIIHHLENSLIKVGERWFKQTQGIAQGCTISTLLCNLYLASIEERFFEPILCSRGNVVGGNAWDKEGFIGRYVDDYLLMTFDHRRAQRVMELVAEGIPSLGVEFSIEKTYLNFQSKVAGPHMVKNDLGECFIPWCGYLINANTLEVQSDYARLDGWHMANAINVPLHQNPSEQLVDRLMRIMSYRCQHMLLDSDINTEVTVNLNVYQMMRLTAMYFHSYVKRLPNIPDATTVSNWINAITRRGVCMIERKIKSPPTRVHGLEELNHGAMVYLGKMAFKHALGGRSEYKDVTFAEDKGKWMGSAMSKKRNSFFKNIKY